MLEPMITTPAPMRTEASNVATAVYDDADAIMLSVESAPGHYPTEAVTMMNSIIRWAESNPLYHDTIQTSHTPPHADAADAISCAVHHMAGLLKMPATATYTSSGCSVLCTVRERPEVSILDMTPRMAATRRLTLA